MCHDDGILIFPLEIHKSCSFPMRRTRLEILPGSLPISSSDIGTPHASRDIQRHSQLRVSVRTLRTFRKHIANKLLADHCINGRVGRSSDPEPRIPGSGSWVQGSWVPGVLGSWVPGFLGSGTQDPGILGSWVQEPRVPGSQGS